MKPAESGSKIGAEIREIIQNKRGQQKSEYKNALTPVSIQCERGHTFALKPLPLRSGKWCPTCESGASWKHVSDSLTKLDIPFSGSSDTYNIPDEERGPIVIYCIDGDTPESRRGVIAKVSETLENGGRYIHIDSSLSPIPVSEDSLSPLDDYLLASLESSLHMITPSKERYSWLYSVFDDSPIDEVSTFTETLDKPSVLEKLNISDKPSSLETPSKGSTPESPNSPTDSHKEVAPIKLYPESKPRRKGPLQIVSVGGNTVLDKPSAPRPVVRTIDTTAETGILGYCRVSTLDQAREGISLESQEAKINDFAKYKGIPVKAIYSDEGISGKDMSGRPALLQLLADVKRGDHVATYSINRLGRNLNDVLEIEKMIKERKATLIILDMNVDTNTSIGRLVFSIMGSVSEHERNTTSERVSMNMGYLAHTGKLRGKPPYGWKFAGKGMPFEAVEEEQVVIERIKELKRNQPTLTTSSIARILNEEKAPLRKAQAWYPTSVKRVIDVNNIAL